MMNKKTTITTLILITSLSLVLSGCLKKEPEINANVNTNQNQNANTNQQAEEIDTSNWKTYRNEEYGFEFKYPEGWTISAKRVADPYYSIVTYNNDLQIFSVAVHEGIFPSLYDLSVDGLSVRHVGNIKVSGYAGLKEISLAEDLDDGIRINYKIIIVDIKKDNILYSLYLSTKDIDDYESLFDLIIKNFIFN